MTGGALRFPSERIARVTFEQRLLAKVNDNAPELFKEFRGAVSGTELRLTTRVRDWDKYKNLCDSAKASETPIHAIHLTKFFLNRENSTEEIAGLVSHINDLVKYISPKVLVLHSTFGDIDTILRNYAAVLDHIPTDLILAIENLNNRGTVLFDLKGMEDFVKAIQKLPENLKICVDAAHLRIRSPETYTKDIIEFIDIAGKRLGHLHLSDRTLGGDARGEKSKKHVPCGSGMIDWSELISHINDAPEGVRATVEVKPENETAQAVASISYLKELASRISLKI